MTNSRLWTNRARAVAAGGLLLFLVGRASGEPIDDPFPELIPAGDVQVRLRTVGSGLINPVGGVSAVGDPHNRLFIGDQPGIVWSLSLDTGARSILADFRDRMVPLNPFDVRGLLGMTVHPDFMLNGLVYTFTSEPVNGAADFSTMPAGMEAAHQSVVIEWTVPNPTDANVTVDPASARVLMRVDQPQNNNNGGAMAFGPDGLLYVSFGDGGSMDDMGVGHSPQGNGQDPTNILGSIIRIDPLGSNSANGQYGIPGNNPFSAVAGPELDEIFIIGFDNPFRHSFDSLTGDFYNATVGTVAVEEINRIEFPFPAAASGNLAGGNFGWPFKEGSFFVDRNGDDPAFLSTDPPPGLPPDLIDPIAEFDQDDGLAVIGGFVYRGQAIPELFGRYVFGALTQTFNPDGRLFYLDENDNILELQILGQDDAGIFVVGFGEDNDGELYVLGSLTAGPIQETGVVLKILPIPEPSAQALLITSAWGLIMLRKTTRCRRARL